MAYYYKYRFVSPETLVAEVKEELKSYFESGAVDDLLFPTWIDRCLKKLGKGSYYITETLLHLDNFQARLPDNFYSVREAWLCTQIDGPTWQTASSFYSQAANMQSIQLNPVTYGGVQCTSNCPPDQCSCMPELIQAVYKTNYSFNQTFRYSHLLTPGNISVQDHCDLECSNYGASSADSFDIRDNKFVTNFSNGTVYLIFYAKQYDSCGYQMVPDNFRIQEYIQAYLRYKVFEQLSNQIVDETYNQINDKKLYYKQLSDEAYIMAESEIKKQDIYTKVNRIHTQLNSFNMYELPTGYRRYRRR